MSKGDQNILVILSSPSGVGKTTITKKLDIELGEGKFEGTMRLTLHEFDKKNGLHKQITVSFTKGQYLVLLKLLESVIPKMIGWQ